MAYSPSTWVTAGADGRLEVFAVGTDHDGGQSLWHRWQTHPATAGRIGVHTEPRQMQMVCAGPRRSHRPQTGAWRSSSSVTIFNPTARDPVERFTGRRRPACNGEWSRWRSYPTDGPNLFGSPAVVRSADGHLELFVLGDDGALWHMWQTAPKNGWSQWVSHGAPPGLLLNSAPSVAAGEDGRLDVFIVSQEAVLWHIGKTAANSDWSDWTSHGSPSGVLFGSDSTPVVASQRRWTPGAVRRRQRRKAVADGADRPERRLVGLETARGSIGDEVPAASPGGCLRPGWAVGTVRRGRRRIAVAPAPDGIQ